jgi:hypothetical protein
VIKDILHYVEWTLTADSLTFNTHHDTLQTTQLDKAKEWLLRNAPHFITKGAYHLEIPLKTMDDYMEGWREIVGTQQLRSARKALIADAIMRSDSSNERPPTFWTAERIPSELPTRPDELSFLECANKQDARYVQKLLQTAGIPILKERKAGPDRNHKTAVTPLLFVRTRDLQKAGITPHSPSYSELDYEIALEIIKNVTWGRTNSFATATSTIVPQSEVELLKEALHTVNCSFQEFSPQTQGNSTIIVNTLTLRMKVPEINIVQFSEKTAIIPRPDDKGRGR